MTFPRSGTHWINDMMQVYFDGTYLPYVGTRANVTCEDPLKIEWGLPPPDKPVDIMWYTKDRLAFERRFSTLGCRNEKASLPGGFLAQVFFSQLS